jgi:hypothetical protein
MPLLYIIIIIFIFLFFLNKNIPFSGCLCLMLIRCNNYKESKHSCLEIFRLFNNYISNNDLIGADLCRKFIQLGTKSKYNNIFLEKLIIINSNEQYIKWINTFYWKNNKPLIPKKYIIK